MLLYHRMGPPKLSSLVAGQYVAPGLLRSQLDYLSGRGWKCASLEDMVAGCGSGAATGDEFCITFDDGYLSVYEHAFPLLVRRNLAATVYVVADTIGGINEWDRKRGDHIEKMMSAAQVREMADAGFDIGSHTLSHPHLTDLSDDQLQLELSDSKKKLEDIIGREVAAFSYPYGDYDSRVAEAAVAAGYKNAVTTELGVMTAGVDPFEIPRVNVRWNALGPLLMRKINRARRASGTVK